MLSDKKLYCKSKKSFILIVELPTILDVFWLIKLLFGKSKFSSALKEAAKFKPNISDDLSLLSNNLNSFPIVTDSPPSIVLDELILSKE